MRQLPSTLWFLSAAMGDVTTEGSVDVVGRGQRMMGERRKRAVHALLFLGALMCVVWMIALLAM